jgi:hypothetical protein
MSFSFLSFCQKSFCQKSFCQKSFCLELYYNLDHQRMPRKLYHITVAYQIDQHLNIHQNSMLKLKAANRAFHSIQLNVILPSANGQDVVAPSKVH